MWDWGLNLGLHACKAGALLHHYSFCTVFLWLFWDFLPSKWIFGFFSISVKMSLEF
jgi:hypothetical protein